MKTEHIEKLYNELQEEILDELERRTDEIGITKMAEIPDFPIHYHAIRAYSRRRQTMKADKLFKTGKALGI